MVRTLNSERRAKFLSSALKLFVANGVMNTSTAEITKEAGTAAGTLFLYFPTKQDLMDELILKIGKEQSDFISSLIEPSFSSREIFSTIWHGTVQWFMDHQDEYQYIQQVRDTRLISDAAVQESAKFFGYYYTAIQKGLAEGSIKAYAVGLIGDFLYQDIVAVMNNIRMEPDFGKREETIRQGFEIYWDGIKSAACGSQDREVNDEI